MNFIAALKEVDASFSTKLCVTSRRYECLTESKKLELKEATNKLERFSAAATNNILRTSRGRNITLKGLEPHA